MATPYITDPFASIKVAIDSTAAKSDRIHAIIGVIDYGILNYGPLVGLKAAPDKTDEECCAAIKAACPCDGDGVKGIDWANVWKIVEPVALQLLQRLLFGGL